MVRSRCLVLPLATAMGVMLASGSTPARGDELGSKMEKVLVGLKSLIDQRMETAVAVGDVTADPSLAASGGPAIANALVDAFQKFGIRVSRKARLSIRGSYKLSEEPTSGLKSLRIELVLSDRVEGRNVTDVTINVVDAATIMRLAGGTGEISGASRKEQSAQVERALNEPTTTIGGGTSTRISAAKGSPYAIEVLVKSGPGDYRPRAATLKEDQAFVPLSRDEVYGIRLINDSNLSAGVELAIDGLEMFAFADNYAERKSRLIIAPRSSGTIIGWYRNNGTKGSNEFLVARAADAAAAKELPASSARLGMVTATFSVAWPRNEAPPAGEEIDQTGRGDLGTALGARTDQTMKAVDFVVGKPKAAVTVRYDKPVEPGDLPAR